MEEARRILKDKWSFAAGISALYLVITLVAGSPEVIGFIISLLVEGPMLLGISIIMLALARGQGATQSQLLDGFQDYLRSLKVYFLTLLFVILWSLLLIIPGIVAALAYSQAFFILADDKSVSARESLRRSKQMMLGHKKQLFFLHLRFAGWFILAILSLGIGFLWFLPYYFVTLAKFYDDIKKPIGV